jgi:LuxR family maltose regulon positive regulatory protein
MKGVDRVKLQDVDQEDAYQLPSINLDRMDGIMEGDAVLASGDLRVPDYGRVPPRRYLAYNGSMPFPLLNTRLTVPPYRSGLIFRSRLVADLQAGVDSGVRLILISAPAGSGKSTLASEWAVRTRADPSSAPESSTLLFAWLSLDPVDDEKLRFWLCLIGALQAVLPGLGQSEQRMLSFPDAPPIASILPGLLNQIGARSERIILILDDYHLITEPSIHDGITFTLEHMPGNLQLVIATRADPPLPLNRLRVRNQLLEIRSADLFFTLPESAMLINDVMGLGLSPEDLAVLQGRTEGWPAGIQLTSVLLIDECRKAEISQIAERQSALVTRLSGRQHLIGDYLLEEVLSRQPSKVQRFLLETSILNELCAPLCDALLENGDEEPASQAVLEYLVHSNLFLIPLEEEHTWFRYHNLFVDALRIRLERTQPGAGCILHQRASRWYERNGYIEEAIEHALSGKDFDQAASLIETKADNFARQGRYSALLSWVEAIPAETALAHPHLIILCSRAQVLSGKLSAAEQRLQAIESSYESTPALLTPELYGQIAAVRAIAAILNADIILAKVQSQWAIDLLPRDDPSLAGVMLIFGDAALMTGQIAQGIQLLRETMIQCRQYNGLDVLLTVFAHLGEGLWMQGSLREVKTICLEALDEVNSQLGAGNWPLSSLALIYTHLGGLKREWNDLTGAEQALTHAVAVAENCADISALVKTYAGLAALHRSQGNIPQAIELIEKGMHFIHSGGSALYSGTLMALRATYWAQAGNCLAAQQWAEERSLSAERTMDYLGEYELTALVRIWIASDRADEADALASRLVAFAEANGQPGKGIGYLVLQALARRNAGRLDLAVQSLERALVLGKSEGFVRVFLDEGEPLFDLLRRSARRKHLASAYARLLLSKIVIVAGQEQDHVPSLHDQALLIEPLTPRELAVLRQVTSGSSNQEIAESLVISIGTVKAHIYHITAKLGARSRTEAVARAREAGLIP